MRHTATTHRRPLAAVHRPHSAAIDGEDLVATTTTTTTTTTTASVKGTRSRPVIRRRHSNQRRRDLSSKWVIVVAVILAEFGIYLIYRRGGFSVVLFDSIADTIVRPVERTFINPGRIVRTEEQLNNVVDTLKRTSKALGYEAFPPLDIPPRNDSSFFHYPSKETMGSNYTLYVLESMGVNRTELMERNLLNEIPPWWQIIENYGNEPVILGLERCQAFRDRVYRRHVAPAGLFSTGTNLLQQMLFDNCIPPLEGQRPRIFNLWQAPWGKHNPASARLQHIAIHQEARNQSAVLPIVLLRHPYTWLLAVCRQPYSLHWNHRQEYCDRSLFLKFPVEAHLGALKHNGNSTLANITYDSLIHVWRDWNLEYFQQTTYPMLMVRFEDLVFRPKQVIEQVCHCAGGKLAYEINETEPFWYLLENANLGGGHGNHRSDLVSAVIRYGQPLDRYHHMYSPLDWTIIHKVLQDSGGLQLTRALAYKQ